MTGQIVPRSKGHETMSICRFRSYSNRRSEENKTLESRGVKVLTKCSRKESEVVATQTILKVDKRLGKHFSYGGCLMREKQSYFPHKLITNRYATR